MNFFAFLDIIGIIIASIIGGFIIAKDSSSSLNKLFFINTLFIIYTAVCEYSYLTATNLQTALVWQKISFLWPFFPAIFLKFVLVYTGNKYNRNLAANILIFSLPMAVSGLHLFSDALYSEVVHKWYGWKYVPSNNIFSYLVLVYLSVFLIFSFTVIIRFYFNQEKANKKKQTLYLFTGFTIPMITGFVSGVLLSKFGIDIPPINSVSYVAGTIFISVGLLKYNAFILSSEDAIKKLFENISDYLIIFNNELEIVSVSSSFLKCLSIKEEQITGKPVNSFFLSDGIPITERIMGDIGNELEVIVKTGKDEQIPIAISASIITKNSSDEKLYMLLGRDLRERKRFEKEYRQIHQRLEERVQIRTEELAKANLVLKLENAERMKTEIALRESEEKYRNLFMNSPIGIYRTTPGGKILFANPALMKMLGFNGLDELSNRNLEDEGFEARGYTRKFFKDEIEKKGEITGWQTKWKCRNGEDVIIRENARCIYDESGQIIYYDGTVEDITEQVAAETALKESEEKFRNLVENINEIFYVADNFGRVIYVSPNVFNFTGFSNEEWTGKRAILMVYREDLDRVLKFYQQNRNNGTLDASIEFRSIKKDGTIFWVEQITRFERDSSGNVIEYRNVVRDINERKKAEEKLYDSERKYKYLFENNPHPMWIYDLDKLLFLLVNDAAIQHYGYSRDEFLKMTIEDIRPSEDISSLHDDLSKYTPELNFAGTWRHKKKDGEIIFVEITSHHIDYDGHNARLVIPYDVTERLNAEKALRDSEEKYRNLIENINEVYFITGRNGKTKYISSNVMSFTGYSPEYFLGKSSFILTYKEDYERVYNFYSEKTKDNTKDGYIEFRAVKKDGTVFWVEQITRFERDTSGKIIDYRSVVRDITERKVAEEKAQLLAQAVKSTGEGISITDVNNNIIFVNDAFIKMYGYAENELLGGNIKIIRSENNPDPLIEDIRKSTLKNGWSGEILNRKKDGTEFPIFLSTSKVINDKGEPYALVGVSRDISERRDSEKLLEEYQNHLEKLVDKRTQEIKEINDLLQLEINKLRVAEEINLDQLHFLQTLIDTIPNPVFYRDANKLFRGCNKAFEKFYGIAKEDIIGDSIFSLVSADEAKFVDLKDDDLLCVPGQQKYETTVTDSKGNHLEVIVSKATFNKSDNTIGGIVGTIIDITEHKKLENEMRIAFEKEKELSELKSRFISVASHEFRTPLTSILASADLLEMYGRKWPETKYFEYIGIIQNSVEYMTDLINDVLTVSKSETGKIKFSPENTNVYDLIRNIFEGAKLSAPGNLKFDFKYNMTEVMFFVDVKLTTQILSNLLSNAIKYSPNGGKISLEVNNEGDYLQLSVADEGIGISENDLALLSEPFHRGQNVGAISGTGLGLSIAKRSADIHRGKLTIESKLNKGTKVIVSLKCKNNFRN